jgi:inosine-uridine nucleoside N-ribohydrolase
VDTKKLYVDVETHGRLTRGMTVVDSRLKPAGEPNVDVAIGVDVQRFIPEFIDALVWWAQGKDGKMR